MIKERLQMAQQPILLLINRQAPLLMGHCLWNTKQMFKSCKILYLSLSIDNDIYFLLMSISYIIGNEAIISWVIKLRKSFIYDFVDRQLLFFSDLD